MRCDVARVQILIVEREEGSARQVEDDLRASGFDAIGRCGASRAVIQASRGRPDLVLIEFDESDPGANELCRTVKAAIEPEFVPVLMLIGEDPASVVRGFEAGADDCIHWPYDLGEMLARVRSMLRIKNLHDELRVAQGSSCHVRQRIQLVRPHTKRVTHAVGLVGERLLSHPLQQMEVPPVGSSGPYSSTAVDPELFKPPIRASLLGGRGYPRLPNVGPSRCSLPTA